jgi:hypothetical protein
MKVIIVGRVANTLPSPLYSIRERIAVPLPCSSFIVAADVFKTALTAPRFLSASLPTEGASSNDMEHVPSSLRTARAGKIDEDASHQLCRHGRQMSSILPFHLSAISQAQLDLIERVQSFAGETPGSLAIDQPCNAVRLEATQPQRVCSSPVRG